MTTATTGQPEERDLLQAAFRSFDEAAQTLQQSYNALTARVEQMDVELAHSNEALRRQLCENEAMRMHLDGILESLSTGVLVVDEREVITRSNLAAEAMFGATEAELRDRVASEVLTGLGLSLCDRPQRLGQTVLSISQVPLRRDSSGGPSHLILIQDVTRIYHLEEQLQRKDRLAAMGELIGRIAHEVRNPLGSVELFASMLQRDLAKDSPAKRYAEQISQAVQSMDRLLANLLLYTKPARMARGWHLSEPLIHDSITLGAHAITKVPIEIRVDIDPDISLLWCHDGQLKQVILNLVVNAVQAMPNGGLLTISLQKELLQTLGIPSVRLTVQDSGVGIDPDHRSRVFDPFFTTKDEGTGLGLAIVYSIVDAHQGRIDVHSTIGQGTTFTIILPHPPMVSASSEIQASEGKEGESEEDEPINCGLALAEEWLHE
ncbi:MAG: ATP-binding protein [Nitrospira sp.]|nr:ATP-binding protein [Nitrospira sp.]